MDALVILSLFSPVIVIFVVPFTAIICCYLYNLLSDFIAPLASVFSKLARRQKPGRDIFIVHSRDDGVKETVVRIVEKLGLNPIVLCERPSDAETIIEKIKTRRRVRFGIVLYAPCGKDGLAEEPTERNVQTRQNVLLEHGYLIAKLGKDDVVALVADNDDAPYESHGAVYVRRDAQGAWKTEIARRLTLSGLGNSGCVERGEGILQ